MENTKYNSNIHHRKSIRLTNYNYSQSGAYFITICTQNKKCIFGKIINGKMILNNTGCMIKKWYYELENKFPDIKCDEFICMPNHVHFIVINVGADLRVCPNNKGEADLRVCPNKKGEHIGSPLQKIVQWFKTMTTNEYIKNVKNNSCQPFDKRFWQRNYYEHIIRNETELNKIREYIINNPLKWELDFENPDRKKEYKDFTDYL